MLQSWTAFTDLKGKGVRDITLQRLYRSDNLFWFLSSQALRKLRPCNYRLPQLQASFVISLVLSCVWVPLGRRRGADPSWQVKSC